jgi:hypothetical protein
MHGVALLTRFLEVLIDCMTCGMCWFLVAWKVLHETASSEVGKKAPPLRLCFFNLKSLLFWLSSIRSSLLYYWRCMV